jgi:hypothetical protein
MAADEQFKYDVAFSFLSQDEALAVQLNDRLKDRLETFIYSDAKRQAVLAGRDGADAFSRVFGAEARTVVVLYRAGWGESGFTAVEATAIRNRGFECSYDFTTFIPLDKPPIVPRWLGRSRLWFDWAKWGVEGAAAVIESRVQEAGGTPRELTAAELAARTVDEIREADERTAFLNSSKGVEAAQREFDALFEEVQRVSATSSGLVVKPERQKNIVSMDAAGLPRTVTFVSTFPLAIHFRVSHFGWSNLSGRLKVGAIGTTITISILVPLGSMAGERELGGDVGNSSRRHGSLIGWQRS